MQQHVYQVFVDQIWGMTLSSYGQTLWGLVELVEGYLFMEHRKDAINKNLRREFLDGHEDSHQRQLRLD